jgi:hypothetical protein
LKGLFIMPSIETIFENFVPQFSSDLQYKAQKEQGVLYPMYSPITMTSVDGQAFDKILPFEMVETTNEGRWQPTQRDFAEYDKIWVFGRKSDKGIMIDKNDDLSVMFSPTSQVLDQAAKALVRWKDRVAYDALGATFQTGKNKGGTEDLGSTEVGNGGNLIPLDSTAAGLTGGAIDGLSIDKLLAAKLFFYNNHLGNEQIYCVCSQNEINQLAKDPRVGSREYGDYPALVSGEVNYYCGINFIKFHDKLDPVAGQSTQKKIYFFVRRGMGFNDIRTTIDVSRLAEQKLNIQVYLENISAAVRFDPQWVCYALVDQAKSIDDGVADLS